MGIWGRGRLWLSPVGRGGNGGVETGLERGEGTVVEDYWCLRPDCGGRGLGLGGGGGLRGTGGLRQLLGSENRF